MSCRTFDFCVKCNNVCDLVFYSHPYLHIHVFVSIKTVGVGGGERELADNYHHFECMSLTGRLRFLPNANGLMVLVKTLQALWLNNVYREINCGPRPDASMT